MHFPSIFHYTFKQTQKLYFHLNEFRCRYISLKILNNNSAGNLIHFILGFVIYFLSFITSYLSFLDKRDIWKAFLLINVLSTIQIGFKTIPKPLGQFYGYYLKQFAHSPYFSFCFNFKLFIDSLWIEHSIVLVQLYFSCIYNAYIKL